MIRNVVWQGGATLVRAIVMTLAFAVAFRHVSADETGRFGIAWAICALGASLIQTPTNQSIIGIKALTGGHVAAAYILSHGFAVVLSFGLLVGASVFGEIYHDNRMAIAIEYGSLVVVLSAFGSVDLALTQRNLNFKIVALVQVLATIAAAVTAMFVLFFASPLLGLLLIQGLLPVYQFLLLQMVGKREALAVPSKAEYRDILVRGRSVALGAFVGAILSGLPAMIIGSVAPLEQVGLFTVCRRLIEQVNSQISVVVNQVLFPTLARMRDDQPALAQSYLAAARYTFALSAVPLLLLSTAPGEVLSIYAGSRWVHGASVLVLLCFMQLGYSLGQNVNPTFLAVERYDFAWKWNAVMATCQGVPMYLFANSALSAAAVLAMTALLVPLSIWYLSTTIHFKMREWLGYVAFPVSVVAVVIALGLAVNSMIPSSLGALQKFALVSGACLALYSATMLLFDKTLNQMVKKILCKIRIH